MARVLVVDDDTGIRETLRFLLEDAGHEVIEAEDGVKGLDLLRASDEPLVVLLDYRMPHLDGGGVLRAAAAEGLHTRHAYALLLATPGLVDLHEDVRQIADELHIPIIAKPFDIDRVLAVVACRAALLNGR
jgi:two-component system chemotaxis response regulator CheY